MYINTTMAMLPGGTECLGLLRRRKSLHPIVDSLIIMSAEFGKCLNSKTFIIKNNFATKMKYIYFLTTLLFISSCSTSSKKDIVENSTKIDTLPLAKDVKENNPMTGTIHLSG